MRHENCIKIINWRRLILHVIIIMPVLEVIGFNFLSGIPSNPIWKELGLKYFIPFTIFTGLFIYRDAYIDYKPRAYYKDLSVYDKVGSLSKISVNESINILNKFGFEVITINNPLLYKLLLPTGGWVVVHRSNTIKGMAQFIINNPNITEINEMLFENNNLNPDVKH